MQAAELVREGRLDEALKELQGQVRKNPADFKLRVFLFQLLCVLGDWERALTQLNVASEMDASSALMVAMCKPALQCEALRAEIFAGRRSPVIFGQPEEWMVWVVQACQLEAGGKVEEALSLREKAFEAAPATSGRLNEEPFEWIADADSRLGPMIEAIINGALYWVPFARIHEMQVEEPADLRDAVWAPARMVLTNGGEVFALIPVRYPGSEKSEDGAIRLARKTEWVDAPGGVQHGLGQRVLATDAEELPLLEARSAAMDNEIEPDGEAGDGAGAGPSVSLGLSGG
jgi:type VI secretion system protein ImpE